MSFLNFKKLFNKKININTESINVSFGSRVNNKIDLRDINNLEKNKLNELLHSRGMLVIPGHQVLSEKEQVEITKYFGTTANNPIGYIGTNTKVKGKIGTNNNTYLASELWHTDDPYLKNPPHVSFFQMVDDADNSWETAFINLHDICANISKEIKLTWNSIHIMYSGNDVIHPLLWVHPFTGRQSIYFDFRFVKEIFSICKTTGEVLIKNNNKITTKLYNFFSTNKAVYNHKWSKGDIIIIDNYAVSRKKILKPSYNSSALLRKTTTTGLYF